MPSIGSNSKPAYVYDAGTDTWIPIGPGEHTHDYIGKDVITTTGDLIYASGANTPARLEIGSTNQVLTVSGGIPSWATPSSPAFVGVSAGGSQSTVVVNGTTDYALVMNVENFDTHGFHDNSTNNTRITIPSGKGGKYLITVSAGFENASSNPGSFRMFIRLNGSGTYNSVSTSQLNKMANSNGAVYNGSNKFNVIGVLNLSAGDYFEVLLNSTNGSGQMNASVLTTATYLGE